MYADEESWKCDKCGKPAHMKISSGGKDVAICSRCMKLVINSLEKANRRRR